MWNMFGSSTSDKALKLVVASTRSTGIIQDIIERTVFELVPLKNLAEQVKYLPTGARVSVTCSPAKGIEHTLALAASLQAQGFLPTPHIAARLVRDRAHLSDIAAEIRTRGFDELFLIAGDAETPAGTYRGAVEVLEDLVSLHSGVERIGVTGYPDGHLFLGEDLLHDALHTKQAILREAGVAGWVSTQMCFDAHRIQTWITAQRAFGLTLPVRLGLPGPIDRTKLLTMGMRVGVGQSLRYLQKNRSGLTKLITGSNYNPSLMLSSLGDLESLGIEGIHLFTFNQLEACVEWQKANS